MRYRSRTTMASNITATKQFFTDILANDIVTKITSSRTNIILSLLLVAVTYSWAKGKYKGPLPPGPKGIPFLGNAFQLKSFQWVSNPTEFNMDFFCLLTSRSLSVQVHGMVERIWPDLLAQHGWSAYGHPEHRESVRRSHGSSFQHIFRSSKIHHGR